MRNDPIVEEVRRVRDAYAAQFEYDLDAMVLDLKRQERESGRKFVSFPAKRLAETHHPTPTSSASPSSSLRRQ